MRADRDPLIAEIKRNNPTKLLVHLRDGESRTVPLSSKSNRWERLAETLAALPWSAIECLNAAGDLLGPVITSEDDDAGDAGEDRDRKLANLLLDVMKTTQKETARQYDAQMSAFVELSQNVMQGLKVVQESYGVAMRVQAATQAAQSVDAGTDGELLKLLGMAMMQRPPQPPPPSRGAVRMPARAATVNAKAAPSQQQAPANGVQVAS